ncbi:methyl-transferase [Legionella beliardensis]|uniref:Methyl-transferase n=1 Tax=Legionella beliardensis TaxID=91822 RepID=A0A378I1N5_9GAMM|nr:methyltransferase domain-containing protein [Legionella beliardensis]STX29097.1 methyl-transferase [Legionella beliardensis]
MSLEEQQYKFQALNEWFSTEQGIKIAQAFFSELAPLKDLLHGDTLLQLGSCGDNLFFSELRFQHKWLATPYISSSSTVITLLNQLPLDRDSVDCIIVPFTLEALAIKSPIDEIDRVLKPSGYAIFLGVNPVSLWGWWLRKAGKNFFGTLSGKPKSVLSIKRAMLHRGYVQCHLSSFYYIPPCKAEKWLARLEFFNEIGKMISPIPAGFYCLVVQKQQENLIGPIVLEEEETLAAASPVSLQPTCKH